MSDREYAGNAVRQGQERLLRNLLEAKIRSQKMLMMNNLPFEDVLRLSEHILTMKKLLTELESITSAHQTWRQAFMPIDELREHCRDLEQVLRSLRENQSRRAMNRPPRKSALAGVLRLCKATAQQRAGACVVETNNR